MKKMMLNNYYRIMDRKYYVIISLAMIVISIIAAVFFTSAQEMNIRLAVVTNEKNWEYRSQAISFTLMEESPPEHHLILGKYDGVIIDRGNGDYEIKTIRNENFRQQLQEFAKTPEGFVFTQEHKRGLGTTIIGYLLFVVLLQTMLFLFALGEDMEFKQLERIAATPVSLIKYLLSHFLCIFILVFAPVFSLLTIIKGFMGIDIGFSLWQYGIFIGVITALGITFAMFIHSLIKGIDTANMIGSSIVVLTTILSGSFNSFDHGDNFLGKVLLVFPQKSILSFVQVIEEGLVSPGNLFQLSYPVMLIILFLTFSLKKIKKDYILRRD